MGSQIDRIQDILKVLVGLPLSHSFRAADMRMLHFGKARVVENGRVGDYALHLQCPWRVEGPDGIVTGSDDLWEPANEDDWHENWSYDGSVTLQDVQLRELLGEPGAGTTSPNGKITRLIVEAVEACYNPSRFGAIFSRFCSAAHRSSSTVARSSTSGTARPNTRRSTAFR